MTSDNMLKGLLKNEKELFLATLGSYTPIDIGTIESINDKGLAIVLSNQYVANQRVIYQDVEVVYPGNICIASMLSPDTSNSSISSDPIFLSLISPCPDTTIKNSHLL